MFPIAKLVYAPCVGYALLLRKLCSIACRRKCTHVFVLQSSCMMDMFIQQITVRCSQNVWNLLGLV